jgi:hypothetical protein
MNRQQFFILFIISALPYAALLARPNMVGADSYYFMNGICHDKTLDTDPLPKIIFTLLPCHEIALKLLLFAIFFTCILFLAFTGELFFGSRGWLAGIFFFLQTQWIHQFMELENDVLAFPLLFFSIYCFCRGIVEKSTMWKINALFLLGIASFFWQGSVYYLVAYALTFPPALLVCVVLFPFLGLKFFGSLVPNLQAAENTPILGYFQNSNLILTFIRPLNELMPQMVYFLLLAFLRLKLAVHVVPFMALSMVATFIYLESKPFNKMAQLMHKIILVSVPIMVLISTWGVFVQYPDLKTFNAVDYAVQEAKGRTINNDWDLGYWIEWKGGTPLNWGGEGPAKPFTKGVVITSFGSDCELLKQFKSPSFDFFAFRDLNVYKCA